MDPTYWLWPFPPVCKQWCWIPHLSRYQKTASFSSNYKWPDGVLCKIVGNIHFAVVQERGQVRFLILGIGHRLGQPVAGNRVQGFQPQPISLKQGLCLHLTRCFSHSIAHFGEFLLQSEQFVAVFIAFGNLFFTFYGVVSIAPHRDSSTASRLASSGCLSGGVLSSPYIPAAAVAQFAPIVHLSDHSFHIYP